MLSDVLNWMIDGKLPPYVLICLGIIYLLLFMYNHHSNHKLQIKEQKNARLLQKDAFFRQNESSELNKVYQQWINCILDLKTVSKEIANENNTRQIKSAHSNSQNSNDKPIITQLKETTSLYGSNKTVHLLANCFQFLYTHNSKMSNTVNACMGITYFACIASSLRFDFLGDKLDPLALLKIQYTDYDDNEVLFKECKNKIYQQLNSELKVMQNNDCNNQY